MKTAIPGLFAVALFFATASAADPAPEGDYVFGEVEVGTTLTAMAGMDNPPEERGMSFDFFTSVPTEHGAWGLLVETETQPLSAQLSDFDHVAAGYETWGPTRSGNADLVEFHYDFRALGGDWSIGLLDSKVHIDASEIANDDKEQFLGTAFVNNPAIAIPDSSLGLSYRREQHPGGPGFTMLAMSSQAASIGTDRRADSLFLALEGFHGFGGLTARLGAWTKGIERRSLAGFGHNRHDRGLYASLDGQLQHVAWNLRGGTARLGDLANESYLGLAFQLPLRRGIMGVGVGHSIRSGEALTGSGGSTSHFELYYRFTAFGRFVITPDVQYHRNSGAHGLPGGLSACVRLRMVI